MESKNDPILDLKALCEEKPRTAEELEKEIRALGWRVPFTSLLSPAEGTYIVKGEDGLYRPRNGTTTEVARKIREA